MTTTRTPTPYTGDAMADEIDWQKVEDATLALMHLTTFKDPGYRSWKGYHLETLKRLHERGWISDPSTKAMSVLLTKEGEHRSRELFEKLFTPDASAE